MVLKSYMKKKGYGKKTPSKKVFKKRAIARASKNRLVRLIKAVSLKQCETKNTHTIVENQQLYHNVPFVFNSVLLKTEIGTNDTDTGTSNFTCRLGDEVVARGISIKMWLANKLDRPDLMYKIVVFKYRSGTTINPNADPYVSQGTSNYLLRDYNVEKFKIVLTRRVRVSTSAQRITSQDVFNGAEGHKAVNIWIPLKNKKIKYEDGSSTPLMTEYAIGVVAYDSYGTLTTDNICSFAYSAKFYFKDP